MILQIRELVLPEGFLATDGILDLLFECRRWIGCISIRLLREALMAELPFMATENIMMDAVKAGGRSPGAS